MVASAETDVAPLVPASLAPLAEAAVQALLREGEAANTRASYRAALRYWAAWYALRYRAPIALPVSEAAVLQYIVDHVPRAADSASWRRSCVPYSGDRRTTRRR